MILSISPSGVHLAAGAQHARTLAVLRQKMTPAFNSGNAEGMAGDPRIVEPKVVREAKGRVGARHFEPLSRSNASRRPLRTRVSLSRYSTFPSATPARKQYLSMKVCCKPHTCVTRLNTLHRLPVTAAMAPPILR